MAALVRHFGDVEDAETLCGICDACDPAGAVLRQFRHASATERAMAEAIVAELRRADFKATGTLQRSVDPAGLLDRRQFDALLEAMVRAGLIAIEDAAFEKDGGVIKFRKVRLTATGADRESGAAIDLLIGDGMVVEFGDAPGAKSRLAKRGVSDARISVAQANPAQAAPMELTPEDEAIAARLKTWRATEAKRLGVPAYVVLHDRTLKALALARPANPKQLLAIDGIGPAKVEKFGDTILAMCCAANAGNTA